MFRRFYALCALIVVMACAPSGPVDFKPLTFTRFQPIYFDVSSIEVVEEYKSPMRQPYVEHLLPYSPAEAMRVWVKDRLRAIGSNRTLQVIVKEGSVKTTTLSSKSWFAFDDKRRYDAVLTVELRIYGPSSAMSEASVIVTANRSIILNEKASVYERDAAFRQMIADMMETLNAELERNMFKYMANYINYSQNP
jgi:hypothetical protein